MEGFKSNTKMKSDMPCYRSGGFVRTPDTSKKDTGATKSSGKMSTSGLHNKFAKGGKVDKDDEKQDKALVKKGIAQHDKNMHGGKKETIKLKDGGEAKERSTKKAAGGTANPKAKAARAINAKKKVAGAGGTAPMGSPLGASGPSPIAPTQQVAPTRGGLGRNTDLLPNSSNLSPGFADGGMPMDGGMPPGGAGGPAGPVDPQGIMELKKRLAALAQQSGGGGAPGGAPMGGGMPAPMGGGMPAPGMADGGKVEIHHHYHGGGGVGNAY